MYKIRLDTWKAMIADYMWEAREARYKELDFDRSVAIQKRCDRMAQRLWKKVYDEEMPGHLKLYDHAIRANK